jgi:uncharacterized protein (DUF1684 family)
MAGTRISISSALVLLALGLLGCAHDAAYKRSVEEWRVKHQEHVASDDGYLTYSALIWLHEGRNSFGSAPGNDAVLPAPVPPQAGYFDLRSGKVTVHVNPGVPIKLGDKPVETAELQPDEFDSRLFIGDLTFYIHHIGTRYALRLKDKNSKLRKEFTGLRWYAVDPAYRLKGRFVAYPSVRDVEIDTLLGDRTTLPMAGYVVFRLKGKEYKLEAMQGDSKELLIVFRDLTSKTETYQAARFLPTDPVSGDAVDLDFNKAYNPPCAFNPYMTCPLPPPGNELPLEIRAGEKRYH